MHLEGTVAESAPCFPRCAGIRDGSVIVLSGPCLYSRTSSISKDGGWLERQIDLEVTADFSRTGCEISRICVFTVDHDELIDVIPLGVRGNRSCVRSGCIRPSDSHAAECSLGVDGRELRFRFKEEAHLWRVCIEDVMTCNKNRWEQLTSSVSKDPPKGYRTHLTHLSTRLSTQSITPPTTSIITDKQLLEYSLKCIDSLSMRVKECKCRKSVDMESEDFLYETRQALLRRINN